MSRRFSCPACGNTEFHRIESIDVGEDGAVEGIFADGDLWSCARCRLRVEIGRDGAIHAGRTPKAP